MWFPSRSRPPAGRPRRAGRCSAPATAAPTPTRRRPTPTTTTPTPRACSPSTRSRACGSGTGSSRPNLYNTGSPNEGGAGDTDFGELLDPGHGAGIARTSPPATPVGSTGRRRTLVIQGGKSGYAYGLCESNGSEVWGVQAAQPGQISPELVGAGGGFIGSPSLGMAKGRPAAFFNAAVFLPFADDGVRLPGDGDDSGATCPGPGRAARSRCCRRAPTRACSNDPARLLSLSAVDAATGHLVWRAPSTPSYAATTYSNGVVFAAVDDQFSRRRIRRRHRRAGLGLPAGGRRRVGYRDRRPERLRRLRPVGGSGRAQHRSSRHQRRMELHHRRGCPDRRRGSSPLIGTPGQHVGRSAAT